MPPAGFEPAIPASKRPQTHALVHAAIGIGWEYNVPNYEFLLTELQNTIAIIITIIIFLQSTRISFSDEVTTQLAYSPKMKQR